MARHILSIIPASRRATRSENGLNWAWAAFCLLQIGLVRWGTDAAYGLAAGLDDVGLALVLLAFFGLLRWVSGSILAASVMVLTALFLAAACLANELYHDTFDTWVGVQSLAATEELDDIQSSIVSMLVTPVLLGWVLLPGLLVGVMCSSWHAWKPVSPVKMMAVGLLCLMAGSGLRVDVANQQENHFLLSALRLEARRVIRSQGSYDLKGLLGGLSVRELAPPMEGYQRPGSDPQPLLQRPLEAKRPAVRPNIILIEAESYRSAESGSYGASLSLTPQLDRLSQQGLLVENFYATGIQTVRGELSALCSTLPALGNSALYKRMPEANLTCLPDILSQMGYENLWFSAYKADYAGKRPFLVSHGVDVVYGVEAHGQKDDVMLGWGISDEAMADRIIERLGQAQAPFMATWITLSNHHPWSWDFPIEFPEHLQLTGNDSPYKHYQRGLYYTDHAIGYFVSRIREQSWGEKAWIVIVGDHGMHVFPKDNQLTDIQKLESHFRVPLLILAPDVIEPGRTERVSSQIDIAPTLLEMMGAKVSNAFWGRNILRPTTSEPSPVVMVGENAASIVLDDERCMVAKVTCYENAQPQCGENESPAPASHMCFRAADDILTSMPNLTRLEPARSARLRRILDLLTGMQTHLETHNKLGAGDGWQDAMQVELSKLD